MPWAASVISYRMPWRCKAGACRLQQDPCAVEMCSCREVSSSSRSLRQPRVEAPGNAETAEAKEELGRLARSLRLASVIRTCPCLTPHITSQLVALKETISLR